MHFHLFQSFTQLGRHKHPLDKIAEINGLLSGLALYPQAFKAIMGKNVNGLSVYTFGFIFASSILWIFYARHRKLPQVLVSSFLNCIAAGLLIGCILIF